jgi:hypothetical protein
MSYQKDLRHICHSLSCHPQLRRSNIGPSAGRHVCGAMEHRWGERTAVDFPVQLRGTAGGVTSGRIANVSASGALIRIDLRLDPPTRIDIVICGLPVPAFVVRTLAGAVGVEWCELAPGIVNAIQLAQAMPLPPESLPVAVQSRGAQGRRAAATHTDSSVAAVQLKPEYEQGRASLSVGSTN